MYIDCYVNIHSVGTHKMHDFRSLPAALIKGDAAIANIPAVYYLRHDPTRRFYIGSTMFLRDKLLWWNYALRTPESSAHLPVKMRDVLKQHGYQPVQWSYRVADIPMPERFNAKARLIHRPEWPKIQQLMESELGYLLLNTLMADKPLHRVPAYGRRGGMAPATYLAIRLGEKRGYAFAEQPPTKFGVQMVDLLPVGANRVPFALYLYRSLKASGVYNPSGEAIAGLFDKWFADVPASEREAAGKAVPYTIDAALAVPTPKGWAPDNNEQPVRRRRTKRERERTLNETAAVLDSEEPPMPPGYDLTR